MPARQIHREVFFAHNGVGPYICYGCTGILVFDEEFPIHHKDGNHENNDPENLEPMHTGCHIRLHKTGRIVSQETRDKIGAKAKGRTVSTTHRAAISAALRRRVWTPEMRAKVSESNKATWRRKSALASQRIM